MICRLSIPVPEGKDNRVLKWMQGELEWLRSYDDPDPTATELAESAAEAFGRAEWLDDPDHWVWDAAVIALEGQV